MKYIFILVMTVVILSCGVRASLKDSLLGSWTDDSIGTIKMEIRKTNIYYPWMPAEFPYKIVGDTIELTRVDGTFFGPINWSAKAILRNDTLLIYDRGGVEKYWRVKP